MRGSSLYAASCASCASNASTVSRSRKWHCEYGKSTTRLNFAAPSRFDAVDSRMQPSAYRSRDDELAFLRHPLKGFARTLDPILAVVAFSWKLSDHLVGTARSRARDIAGSKVDGRSNRKLVLQHPLHHTQSRSAPHDPSWLSDGWKPGGVIACAVAHWPATSEHGKCAIFSGFSE